MKTIFLFAFLLAAIPAQAAWQRLPDGTYTWVEQGPPSGLCQVVWDPYGWFFGAVPHPMPTREVCD
jgi:hypothetical protein